LNLRADLRRARANPHEAEIAKVERLEGPAKKGNRMLRNLSYFFNRLDQGFLRRELIRNVKFRAPASR